MSARQVTVDGFVMFYPEYALAGDATPFRWVRGRPIEYGDEYRNNAMCQFPITFTLPEGFHPTASLIAAMEAQREQVRREFTKRIAEINEQIGKLQALTNEVQS